MKIYQGVLAVLVSISVWALLDQPVLTHSDGTTDFYDVPSYPEGRSPKLLPPSGTPPEKIVYTGYSQVTGLLGLASQSKVKEILAEYGYKPSGVLGKTPVSLSMTVNDEFIGCGCPKAFNEFSIVFSVRERAPGKWFQQVVQYQPIADHPQRIRSMGTKFGTVVSLGKMKVDDHGFEIFDESSKSLLMARADEKLPVPKSKMIADYGFHSIGGIFEGQPIDKKFFRTAGPVTYAARLFGAKDQLLGSEDSPIFQTLKRINFKPNLWMTSEMREGYSWIQDKK